MQSPEETIATARLTPVVVLTPDRLIALYGGNEPPTETELLEVQDSISETESDIERLDNHISRVRESLRALEFEREPLAEKLAYQKRITHPLRRMPDDILTEIFLACIDEDVGHTWVVENEDSFDLRQAPWVLVQVCKRWREVTLSYPRLWSTIRLSLHDSDGLNSGHFRVSLLVLLLQRSAMHPLSVSINSPPASHSSGNKPFLHPLLQVLLPTSSRWKSARFTIPGCLSALDYLHGSLQNLRYLDIVKRGFRTDPASTLNAFEFAPSLRCLAVHAYRLTISTWALPWNQLTSIEYDGSVAETLTLLHMTSANLQEARLTIRIVYLDDHGEHVDPQRPDTEELVVVQQLKHLSISQASSDHSFVEVLDSITLPSLSSLSVELFSVTYTGAVDNSNTSPSSRLIALLQRSQCSLDTIELHFDMQPAEIMQLFQCSPTLRLFDSRYMSSNEGLDQLLDALTRDRGSPSSCLVPELQTIKWSIDSEIDQMLCQRLLDMVESRARGENDLEDDTALRTCGIWVDSGLDPDSAQVRMCIQRCRARGMDVDISRHQVAN